MDKESVLTVTAVLKALVAEAPSEALNVEVGPPAPPLTGPIGFSFA